MSRDDVMRVLDDARSRIERGWCQHAYAVDADGKAVSSQSARACKWCPDGALSAAGQFAIVRGIDTHSTTAAYSYLVQAVREATNGLSIWDWNDHPSRTQAEVLAMFDRAKALVTSTPSTPESLAG